MREQSRLSAAGLESDYEVAHLGEDPGTWEFRFAWSTARASTPNAR